ncbi:5717_t:CDS:2, partial [Racocetra persica]
LLQNPEATPNITGAMWKNFISIVNTSHVFQAPDAIHFFVALSNVKVHFMALGIKVDPDLSNVVTELFHTIQTLYEFASKGIFPINLFLGIRIIKSSDALLSNVFNHDPKTLYCQMDFVSVLDTPGWEEFTQLIAQRFFYKYKAKPHWGKEWEFIPNVKSYLSDVLSVQIKQFEK